MDLGISTLTFVGTVNVGGATVYSYGSGATVMFWYSALVGSCTGKRYSARNVSTIDTYGSGPTFIPGSIAGEALSASGGYYL